MKPKYCVVLITVPTRKESIEISTMLIKENLAACVNIVKNIDSVYWWQGKIEQSKEFLLIIKTVKVKMKKLIIIVKQVHSYTVPEIISLPIETGNKDYLEWISDSVDDV